MLKKVKNQKGFTLIELIAVIAILGILALLIIPRVANYSNDAKVSRFKGDLTALKNAIERYNLEHTSALTTLDNLTVKTNEDGTVSATGTKGPYLGSIPAEWDGYPVSILSSTDPNDIAKVISVSGVERPADSGGIQIPIS